MEYVSPSGEVGIGSRVQILLGGGHRVLVKALKIVAHPGVVKCKGYGIHIYGQLSAACGQGQRLVPGHRHGLVIHLHSGDDELYLLQLVKACVYVHHAAACGACDVEMSVLIQEAP